MWVLIWLHFFDGKLQYYQVGEALDTMESCRQEQAAASVLVTDRNQGLFCLEVDRE
jgi:hypothetical protein